MFNEFLTKSGLTKDQARIYETLLESGALPARRICLKTTLGRPLVYKVLDQLIELGLVQKNEELSKVTLFFPSHPQKVKEVFEKKMQEMKATASALGGVMGQMTSAFNLISGKPNVQFFEGLDGVKKVLEDSLETDGEILSYADIESIEKHISKLNEWYVGQREKRQIKKRGFVLDTEWNRKFLSDYYTNITDTKFIKADTAPFKTVMQIYENKISYITLDENTMIGVIIEDKNIAKMHKYLFESLWKETMPQS